MKFSVYSSMNDNGYYAVSKSLCLQPENVLGLLMYSQTPGADNLTQQWFDSLAELTDEYGGELSKYQGVVLVTAPVNNLYDLQLTFFSIRGPLDHLTFITSLVGDVLAAWISSQPKKCKSIMEFHKLTDADYVDWANSSLGVRDEIADLIAAGYKRLINLNAEAKDRQKKADDATDALLKSMPQSRQ